MIKKLPADVLNISNVSMLSSSSLKRLFEIVSRLIYSLAVFKMAVSR